MPGGALGGSRELAPGRGGLAVLPAGGAGGSPAGALGEPRGSPEGAPARFGGSHNAKTTTRAHKGKTNKTRNSRERNAPSIAHKTKPCELRRGAPEAIQKTKNEKRKWPRRRACTTATRPRNLRTRACALRAQQVRGRRTSQSKCVRHTFQHKCTKGLVEGVTRQIACGGICALSRGTAAGRGAAVVRGSRRKTHAIWTVFGNTPSEPCAKSNQQCGWICSLSRGSEAGRGAYIALNSHWKLRGIRTGLDPKASDPRTRSNQPLPEVVCGRPRSL